MRIYAFNSLICPIDSLLLTQKNQSLMCDQGHVFDIAREGYCNLLLVQEKASLDPGDNKQMVAARHRFLQTGYFNPIIQRIWSIAEEEIKRSNQKEEFRILDAGCGEGYYLQCIKNLAEQSCAQNNLALVGSDISKWAIKLASRQKSEISWVVASNKHLPFPLASIDVILSVFGYPHWESFVKILKPSGRVILVDSGPSHLVELRRFIYPEIKPSDLPSIKEAEKHGFNKVAEVAMKFNLDLYKDKGLQDILAMTPHAYRIDSDRRKQFGALEKIKLTVDIVIRVLSLP